MQISSSYYQELYSYEDAPADWLEYAVTGSFFNLTNRPACMHIRQDGHDWYTKLDVDGLGSPEENYSASVVTWHLVNTGSRYDEWNQQY